MVSQVKKNDSQKYSCNAYFMLWYLYIPFWDAAFQKESGDDNLEMYLASSYWCTLMTVEIRTLFHPIHGKLTCYVIMEESESKTISMFISKLSVCLSRSNSCACCHGRWLLTTNLKPSHHLFKLKLVGLPFITALLH